MSDVVWRLGSAGGAVVFVEGPFDSGAVALRVKDFDTDTFLCGFGGGA